MTTQEFINLARQYGGQDKSVPGSTEQERKIVMAVADILTLNSAKEPAMATNQQPPRRQVVTEELAVIPGNPTIHIMGEKLVDLPPANGNADAGKG